MMTLLALVSALYIPQPCSVQAMNVLTTCLENVEPHRFEVCFKAAEAVLEQCRYQKASIHIDIEPVKHED